MLKKIKKVLQKRTKKTEKPHKTVVLSVTLAFFGAEIVTGIPGASRVAQAKMMGIPTIFALDLPGAPAGGVIKPKKDTFSAVLQNKQKPGVSARVKSVKKTVLII